MKHKLYENFSDEDYRLYAKKLISEPNSRANNVPQITKIVLNRALQEKDQNAKALQTSLDEMSLIAGQKATLKTSKKAIAAFKIRENTPLGISVTLRGQRMYEFLERLIFLALPRIRDFQGLNPKSFDGAGNYSLGLEEQLMFPEIDYETINESRGMDITFVTNTADSIAYNLLKGFGMPFKESKIK